MKDSMWFLILGLVLLFLVLKKKGSTTTGTNGATGALPNTNTATTAPAPWLSSISKDVQAVEGTYKQVSDAVGGASSGLFSIFGLFGGSSRATGTQTPATSGSGVGVVNDSQAGDNSGSGSPDGSGDSNILPFSSPYDQFGLGDFGGSQSDATAMS